MLSLSWSYHIRSLSTLVLLSISSWFNLCGCFNQFSILKTINPTTADNDLPALPSGALINYEPKSCPGWVTVSDNHLYLDGRLFDFRSFNAPSLLEGTLFEATDTFRSISGFGAPVTRTYTLRIGNEIFKGSQMNKVSHIVGWDPSKEDWIYNEQEWVRFDSVLNTASNEGVKIIFPIINQDYGKIENNYKGNWMDLIRHRYNVTDYNRALLTTDWFVDRPIREAFKKIIKYTLERRNTINGKIYGHDDTFLAFETGNELNWTEFFDANTNQTIVPSIENQVLSVNSTLNFTMNHIRPAPGEWTVDIAKYIKSLAPNALVMDGSYFQRRVESFGKVFIVGEHGFYPNMRMFKRFNDIYKGPGALIWSLRPHSEVSGFTTHSEGSNIYAYHVPGWKNQTAETFDQNEYDVVRLTFQSSYEILNKEVPDYPLPGPTHPFFATNGSATGISFKGSAWAERYEIWGATFGGLAFIKVAEGVTDNVELGKLFIQVDPSKPTLPLYIPPWDYLVGPRPSQTGWNDNKWSDSPIEIFPPGLKRRMRRSLNDWTDYHQLMMPPAPSDRQDNGSLRTSHNPTGGWYRIRSISVDGTPGYFSQPVFISDSDSV
ncbi:family 5 glycoside hydrolase [Phakopsora pachyrhizi]|nr:family 5 glycoside hydrolase [Phakopsora pachyrhizi]